MSSTSILERYGEKTREPAQEVGRPRPMPRAVRLVGFWSAAVLAVMTIAYAVVQPFTSPPAEWHGMAAYSASFNPVSLTWLYPALLLAPAFVVAMVSVHRAMPEERRLWTQLGVVFACLYAPIQTLNYAVQLLAVAPSIQAGETEGLAFFAFANPTAFSRRSRLWVTSSCSSPCCSPPRPFRGAACSGGSAGPSSRRSGS